MSRRPSGDLGSFGPYLYPVLLMLGSALFGVVFLIWLYTH